LEGGLRLAAIIAKTRVAGMMPVGRKLRQVVCEGLREDKPATEPHKGVCCDAYSQSVRGCQRRVAFPRHLGRLGRGDALRQAVETPSGDRHRVPRNHSGLREQLAPGAAPAVCDQLGRWDLDHRQRRRDPPHRRRRGRPGRGHHRQGPHHQIVGRRTAAHDLRAGRLTAGGNSIDRAARRAVTLLRSPVAMFERNTAVRPPSSIAADLLLTGAAAKSTWW
jgi:hypothetical protein